MILAESSEGREKSIPDETTNTLSDTTLYSTASNNNNHRNDTPLSTTVVASSTYLPEESLTKDPLTNDGNMVHIETESPHRPCHQDSTNDEKVDSVPWKLGRVSNSTSDNENDHGNGDTNTATPKSENRPLDADCLLQAIEVLNGLATIDSCSYQTSLLERKNARHSPQVQTALETTPQLVKLHQSIHRFHSLIRNLTTENDHQTMELLDLHQTLQAKNERMAQLEAAVTKLHKRNCKLKEQSKSSQSKARKLIKQVQEFTTNATKRRQQEEFNKLAMQVQHHEQIMMNRERTDSNFSDLDGLQDFFQNQDARSVGSDVDTVSTHSSVFDDGVATLRISRERTSTWPHPSMDAADGNINNSEGVTDQHHQKLAAIELEESTSKANHDGERDGLTDVASPPRKLGNKHHHAPNPFAMLLGQRPVQPYTLQFLEPFEMQFVALLVSEASDTTGGAGTMTEQTSTTTTAFAVCGYHGFDASLNVKPTMGARLLQINKKDLDPSWTVQDVEEQIRAQGSRCTMTFRNDAWTKSQKEALQMAIQEQERLFPPEPSSSALMINPFARKPRSQSSDVGNSSPAPMGVTTPSNKNLLGFLNFGHSDSKKLETPKSIKKEDRQTSETTVKTSHSSTVMTPTDIARSDSKDSHDSTSPLNQNPMSAFWRRSNGSPSRLTRTSPAGDNRSNNDEFIFSVEDDEASSSLFMPMPPDAVVEQRKDDIESKNPEDDAPSTQRGSGRAADHETSSSLTTGWKPGCVVKLEGMPETADRTSILDVVASVLGSTVQDIKSRKLVKVDLVKGHATEAVMRFAEPSSMIAELVERLNNGALTIRGEAVSKARILEGEEEEHFWRDFIAYKFDQVRNSSSLGSSQGEEGGSKSARNHKSNDAGQKFKSSMMQMGKMFAFR